MSGPGSPARIEDPERGTSPGAQAAEVALQQMGSGQLAAIRKAAESWRNGLGGLAAVVTGALFIKGPSAISEIDTGWTYVLGVLVGAAIVFALIGGYYAMRAAYGDPDAVSTQKIIDAGGVGAWSTQLATSAADDLKSARGWSYVAVFILLVAIFVTWYAPERTPDPPAKLEVRAGAAGAPVCGTAKGIVGGNLKVEAAGKSIEEIPLSNLTQLAVIEKCP